MVCIYPRVDLQQYMYMFSLNTLGKSFVNMRLFFLYKFYKICLIDG